MYLYQVFPNILRPLRSLLVQWVTRIPLFPRRYLIGTRVDAASEGEKVFRTLAVCEKRSFPALQSPFSRCPRAFFELAVLHLQAICEEIRHPTHAGSKGICSYVAVGDKMLQHGFLTRTNWL